MSQKTTDTQLFARVTQRTVKSIHPGDDNDSTTTTTSSVTSVDSPNHVEPLQKSLRPLLVCMTLVGLYFDRPSGGKNHRRQSKIGVIDTDPVPKSVDSDLTDNSCASSGMLSQVYSFAVVLALWLNAIRMLTVYEKSDVFGPTLLTKCVFHVWFIQCAIQQTAYFMACRSGRLQRVLQDMQLKSMHCYLFARGLAAKFAGVAGIFSVINVVFIIYSVCFSDGFSDSLLAPVGNYIKVPNPLPYRIVFVMIGVYLSTGWVFPIAMSALLATLFSFQFRDVINQLRSVIDADGNLKEGEDIELIRRKHQTLCRSVKRADQFMKYFNFAAFCGPLFGCVVLLYTVIFYNNILRNPIILLSDVFWLVGGCVQISITTASGIMVNHCAHKIYERVHSINMKNMNTKTVGKVNIFLSQLSGEPIGFTVLDIIVIDRNTILSLLGLLITYFLIVVQMTPSSTSAGETSYNVTSAPN